MKARSLHLITTGSQTLREVLPIIEKADLAGVDYLHIREKQRTAREIAEWIRHLSDVFPRDRIIVNDRVDVAIAYHCGGVQLGQHSMHASLAGRMLDSHQLLGCSVHNEQECLSVQSLQPADQSDSLTEHDVVPSRPPTFVIAGHVYVTKCKPGIEPRGLPFVTRMRKLLAPTVSLLAIGGITPHRVKDVIAAGGDGIAVMSGIMQSARPQDRMREYRDQLDNSAGYAIR
ncbi:thiamine phosphate synthase [Brevibacillus laterosporus]|uniref:thiamine phosphate synthase n=1 Tax=Brevibacillus laterosporus TaxID=1465 RepID=UPI002655B7E5|nr:thiamine phosphate synthase [Brevibacillus laterosporus]MDN9009675.1 thiamine phosphate synthase [Brevibacillus laterosporus]MDO0940326.1 thiamine phosphate synthase [Brevibacillus laterosporus]